METGVTQLYFKAEVWRTSTGATYQVRARSDIGGFEVDGGWKDNLIDAVADCYKAIAQVVPCFKLEVFNMHKLHFTLAYQRNQSWSE